MFTGGYNKSTNNLKKITFVGQNILHLRNHCKNDKEINNGNGMVFVVIKNCCFYYPIDKMGLNCQLYFFNKFYQQLI